MSSDENILQMENISKQFPGVKALDNVSFDIKMGEVHALVGENGAGKSSLVKILSGLYSKDDGKIKLFDNYIEIPNPRKAIELGISTMYQEIIAVPNMTVAENILLGHWPKNKMRLIDWKEMKNEARKILNDLSINLNVNELVSNLSAAQKQLVEIAKALSTKSKIVIMDEPTAPLTEDETENLFNIIRRIKSKGISVIYISHRLNEIFKIADRLSVLRDGRKIITKDVEETNYHEVVKYMIGREIDEMYSNKIETPSEKLILKVRKFSNNLDFKNINFDLYEGEILGFAGLMGAGRSEVAKAIFGLSYREKGELYFNGRNVNINSPLDAIRLGMGLVPEERNLEGLILNLSVDKNITAASLKNISRKGFLSRNLEISLASRFIKKLSIKCSNLSQKIMYLSGGNQQKTIIARWLALKPKLLILDEPTKGIDVGSKSEIHKLIVEIARGGTSIILISSELAEILKISHRIAVMREGEISTIISSKEASEELLMQYMTGVKK